MSCSEKNKAAKIVVVRTLQDVWALMRERDAEFGTEAGEGGVSCVRLRDLFATVCGVKSPPALDTRISHFKESFPDLFGRAVQYESKGRGEFPLLFCETTAKKSLTHGKKTASSRVAWVRIDSVLEVLGTVGPSLRGCRVCVEKKDEEQEEQPQKKMVLRSATARKKKEEAVAEKLQEMVQEKKIPAFVRDKVFWEGIRPDFLWNLNDSVIVILEVDENQHRAYSKFGETAREIRLVEGCKDKTLVLIRYNPDATKKTKNVSDEKRLEILSSLVERVLGKWAAKKPDEKTENKFTRYKLFYDCDCAAPPNEHCTDFTHMESWKDLREYFFAHFAPPP